MADNFATGLFSSTARTATASSASQKNPDHLGVHVTIKSTAATSTPSVVPTIEGYDETTGAWYTLLTGAAITDGSTTVTLKVYPGITAVNNVAVSDHLPPLWRLTMTHADTDSITYSAGANLLL